MLLWLCYSEGDNDTSSWPAGSKPVQESRPPEQDEDFDYSGYLPFDEEIVE